MDMLTGALYNYQLLGYTDTSVPHLDHLYQAILTTQGYHSSIITGYFPLR
jgi:hypothetical protein